MSVARFPGRLTGQGHSHRFKGGSLVSAAGVYGEEPALPASRPAGNAPHIKKHPRTRTAEKSGCSWAYWQFDSDFIVYDIPNDRWVEPIRDALLPAK
jgi:hypothetical protein